MLCLTKCYFSYFRETARGTLASPCHQEKEKDTSGILGDTDLGFLMKEVVGTKGERSQGCCKTSRLMRPLPSETEARELLFQHREFQSGFLLIVLFL